MFIHNVPLPRYRVSGKCFAVSKTHAKKRHRVLKLSRADFDSQADVLVNPTNPEGVMGGGLALLIQSTLPQMNHAYKQRAKGT